MRRAAMKLHTRDQAPREGKQDNKGVAFSDWKPSRCAAIYVGQEEENAGKDGPCRWGLRPLIGACVKPESIFDAMKRWEYALIVPRDKNFSRVG